MSRPKLIDCFMFNQELEMLEARLVEIGDSVDHIVIVEADVTHQDRPKPLHFMENRERFAPWLDKIVQVTATGLPKASDDPDAWSRENAQREWIGEGLARIGVSSNDLIFQSDVDEIPRAFHVRNVRTKGLMAFGQRFHPFAVDWRHPELWKGTVVGSAIAIKEASATRPFSRMRDCRNIAPCPPHMRDAGWHFTWVGGLDYAWEKLAAFCHPEIAARIDAGLKENVFFTEGWHVDGTKLKPVEVDASWPKWITEGHAPASWFRPR